ncbi:hypothetical protein BM1_05229 [Bipolaris maydis]|nr:hypothetical protein BM1_05229 [Bipolaris maydis]
MDEEHGQWRAGRVGWQYMAATKEPARHNHGRIASLALVWMGKTIEHGPWAASGTRPAFGGEGGERGERGAANACRLESCLVQAGRVAR